MQIDVTDEERGVLIRWKRRSVRTPCKLVRTEDLRAEAIVYAWRGFGLDIITEMVERAEGTVRKWLSQWRRRRLQSVVTGHAVGENAAKFKRAQKEELEEILNKPPSEAGVEAELWDAHGSLRMSRLIRFGARYRSDSSYRLLMRFLGMSLCCQTRSTSAATRRPSPGG